MEPTSECDVVGRVTSRLMSRSIKLLTDSRLFVADDDDRGASWCCMARSLYGREVSGSVGWCTIPGRTVFRFELSSVLVNGKRNASGPAEAGGSETGGNFQS